MIRRDLKKVLDMSEAGVQRIAENFMHPDDLITPFLEEDNQSDVAKMSLDKDTE